MDPLNIPIPANYKQQVTLDGSLTFFSERFNESAHSLSGAKTETLVHYIKGCQIESKDYLSILEVGFGSGLGLLTTLEALTERKLSWSFLSVEIDEELIEWFRSQNTKHPLLSKLNWITLNGIRIMHFKNELIEINILSGDARETLKEYCQKLKPSWNAIYQDAFSPKKNPHLWTKEWFELLKAYSNSEVILSTYSASSSIRKSLIDAGWSVQNGEKFGLKRSSTKAQLKGISDPEIIQHLSRSPVPAIRDDKIDEFLQN